MWDSVFFYTSYIIILYYADNFRKRHYQLDELWLKKKQIGKIYETLLIETGDNTWGITNRKHLSGQIKTNHLFM